MKIVVRTFALSLMITGLATGAFSRKPAPGTQLVPATAPVPSCPLNSGDCGLSKF